MPLSTSNFNMWQLIKYLFLVGLVALVCIELYFRSPLAPIIMKYDFHPQRFYSLAPNQPKVHEMLANFSVLSPPYRINADGFRGPEILKEEPTIALVGSSEVLGEGVQEEDTISAHLQRELEHSPVVTNLGVVGYGPEHHVLVVDWAMEQLALEALVVRVTVKQRYSYLREAAEFPAEKAKKERNLKIRQVSRSAPFLFVKAIHQFNSPLHSFQRYLKTFKPVDPLADQKIAAQAWEANGKTWQAILDTASNNAVPILFYVENGAGSRSENLLCKYLEQITRPPMSTVVEMGPSFFGLDDIPKTHLTAEFKRNYTLGFDPHGNSAQYKMLAKRIDQWWQGDRGSQCDP